MSDDPRCCGSGNCIIDPDGRCWCGRQWDGRDEVRLAVEAEDQDQVEQAVSESSNRRV